MKMYGVFSTVPENDEVKLAESDKQPIALCRHTDTANTICKSYSDGLMEVREVDVTEFEVVTRRIVQL